MNKIYAALIALALPAMAMAQSAIDAMNLSQSDLKGTARFVSMGGAFTALGGDLSTMNQNPAGIGIYRSSEIGGSICIDFQSTSTEPATMAFPSKWTQTKTTCPNVGYVGSTPLDGTLRAFNWGVSYGRIASFDRAYRGYVGQTTSSLTNYIAAFMNGVPESSLNFNDSQGYNPYYDSDADWLGILAYNSYLINPTGSNSYEGLYKNGTIGDASFQVMERGYVDEYNISFGGNVDDVVYWGLGVGITDINYIRSTGYDESMENAIIPNLGTGNATTTGDAYFNLTNRKFINGTGWNIKLGLILKPINELRIGVAFHTPTWYNLNQGYDGVVDYRFYNPMLAEGDKNPFSGNEYTENANFDWHFRSPWRVMAGVAAVLGGRAILSVDYEYDAYKNMSIATPTYFNGYADNFQPNEYLNAAIKQYFKGTNNLRLGLELRVTPQFSVRAGYNLQSTNVKPEAREGAVEILTNGTDPSFSFNKTINYITCGLGYRYQAWYIDAAYVYKNRESTYHAYSNWGGIVAPQSKVTDHNSMLVISTGFKF